MALPTYSSRKVSVAWSGIPFEGFAPDSFITFSRNTDITDEEIGADSQLSISIMPDLSGTCTVSLQKESPTNIALSGLLLTQQVEGGIYIADLIVTDPSGSSLARMSNAHIKTSPEQSFGSTATGITYDWVFFCEKLEFLSVPAGILPDNPNLAAAASAIDTAANFLNDIG